MAMKIKKRGNRREQDPIAQESGTEPLEGELLEGDEAAAPQGAYADLEARPPAFDAERAAYEGAAWFDRNRGMVLTVTVVLLLAGAAAWAWFEYTGGQEEAASDLLSEAIEPYSVLVETSPQYQQLKSTPNFKLPAETFPTDEAKWQAIYKEAGEALQADAQVRQPARLARAAAAMQLGKYEEAATLYREALNLSLPLTYQALVGFGLAQALAAQGKHEEAIGQLDALVEKGDQQIALLARYRKGTLLEQTGKVEEAKSIYHELLEKNPQNPYQADIKRRLAIL